MSLAMAVVTRDYIITSSDSAVTLFPYDEKLFEKTGEYVRTGKIERNPYVSSEKVDDISNNVYLLATGSSHLTETVRVELSHFVNMESDLEECMKHAKKVIRNMRERKVVHWNETINSLLNKFKNSTYSKDEYFRDLKMMDDEKNLTAYLVGFNKDGSSGVYDLIEDNYLKVPEDIRKGYPTLIVGETGSAEKFSMYQKIMTLPPEERTFDNFVKATLNVHAMISYEHNINVSSDCNFRTMIKASDGGIERIKFTIDTEPLYKLLELEPK